MKLEQIKKILVIKVRAMGDTLLATPTLRALRRAYPEATITFVVSPIGRTIIQGNPDIDHCRSYEKKGIFHWLKFVMQLRREKYDLAIALHASYRTALLARMSNARYRVVHNHSGENYFSTIPLVNKKEAKSTIQRDLDVIRALELPEAGEALTLTVSASDREIARVFLEEHGLGDKPFYLLSPCAGKVRKQWTAGQSVEFLNQVSEAVAPSAAHWILLAGRDDLPFMTGISRQAKAHPPVFCADIKAAAALMQLSRGMVTADSGPKHIAVAMGVKTLTLWTDEPEAEWHPYPGNEHGLLRSATGIVADIPARDVVGMFKQMLMQEGNTHESL